MPHAQAQIGLGNSACTDAQLAKERLLKESNALAERVAKAHRDMEEQIAANTALLAQTSHKRLELLTMQDEIVRLKARNRPTAADHTPEDALQMPGACAI